MTTSSPSPTDNASELYYRKFAGSTFVIEAEGDALEDKKTTAKIVMSIAELMRHEIRVSLVYGKTRQFERELRKKYRSFPHPETNRLVVPEQALSRLAEERQKTGDAIRHVCEVVQLPYESLSHSVVHAERRINHKSTGTISTIDAGAVQTVLDRGELALIGFGGVDDREQFLHVPSVSIAGELATSLQAQKLIMLTHGGGVFVPGRRGGKEQLSFADLEQLLCLLQRDDAHGRPILSGDIVTKVHACIAAVAGGVRQVHMVSNHRLLDEILTRTGVGTMIEKHQSHHVDFASLGDIDAIEALHREALAYKTELGASFLKPLTRDELLTLVPSTLLLKHRGIIVGKLHAETLRNVEHGLLLGGFVIGENQQNSQQGQLLLSEALSRFKERGHQTVVSITASPHAAKLFERSGGVKGTPQPWQQQLRETSRQRYPSDEQNAVQLFTFDLSEQL